MLRRATQQVAELVQHSKSTHEEVAMSGYGGEKHKKKFETISRFVRVILAQGPC